MASIEIIIIAAIWFFAGWSIAKANEVRKNSDRIEKEIFDSKK